MPKTITRKIETGTNLPPLEQTRSALSVGLEKMAAKQKDAFQGLSKDGNKMFQAIKAMDRYAALSGPSGYIADTQTRLSVSQAKVEAALNDFKSCIEEAEEVRVQFPNPPESAVGRVEHIRKFQKTDALTIRSARALAQVADELNKRIHQLKAFKKELDELEPIVIGDEVIPDFKTLRDTKSETAVAANQGEEARALLGDSNEGKGNEECPSADAHSVADNYKPIRWEYWLEKEGTVIAPSEESARGVLAMRLKYHVKPQDFKLRLAVSPCHCGGSSLFTDAIPDYGRKCYVHCVSCREEIFGETKEEAINTWNEAQEAYTSEKQDPKQIGSIISVLVGTDDGSEKEMRFKI